MGWWQQMVNATGWIMHFLEESQGVGKSCIIIQLIKHPNHKQFEALRFSVTTGKYTNQTKLISCEMLFISHTFTITLTFK